MDSNCLGGRYKIIGQLGAGGFSRTFLVQDLHLPNNPRCVIKQLKPQTMEPKSMEMARRLFDTEARVLYQVGEHGQIPTLLAHFEEHQEFYLAQEYIEGIQLSWEISKRAPFSETRTILLLREILSILAFVHQKQVIHRDVKPSNLIRRYRDSKIVLIDFGAVKEVSKQKSHPELDFTSLTVAVGTQGYMPNEQLAGRPRFSSDVYAVGIIGIRALTGIHPKHFKDDFQTGELDWHQHVKSASPELISIVDRMVKYDFRDRYLSAVEALAALENIPTDPEELAKAEHDWMFHSSDVGDPHTRASDEVMLELPDGYPPPLTAQETTTSLVAVNIDEQQESPQISPEELEKKPSSGQRALKVLTSGGLFVVFLGIVSAAVMNTDWFASIYETYINRAPLKVQTPSLGSVPSGARAIWPVELLVKKALIDAESLRASGEYEAALMQYEQATEIQRDLPEAYLGQCELLNILERPNDAIVACNDALAYRPGYPEAIRSKGNAVEQQGFNLEALRLYERATLFDPELFEAWLDQGRVLQMVGRSAEAIPVIERAIALDRESVEAWSLLGDALWRLQRYTKAIEALDKALTIDAEYPAAVELRQRARDRFGR